MVRDTSHHKAIVDYVKKNLEKGYTKDSLKWALINQGYMKIEVEKAFRIVEEEMPKMPPLRQEPRQVQVTSTIQVNPEVEQEKVSFWKKWFG